MTAPAPTVDYFAQLCQGLGLHPDRKGEVWLKCPSCGKERDHFSFSANGAFCLKCGYKPRLRALFEALIGGVVIAPASLPVVTPARPRPWQPRARALAESFAATPGQVAAWQRYKPLPEAVIRARRLGLGIFPGGLHFKQDGEWRACRHRRLIVPLYAASEVVGFRCRAFECGCKKWLSPGGSSLMLYGAEHVRAGLPLAIVENPIDSLLIESNWGWAAVATLGVTVWKEGYTAQVAPAAQICVAFDNDDPGRAATIKLSNTLLTAGLHAWRFDWAGYPAGADIGSLFQCSK